VRGPVRNVLFGILDSTLLFPSPLLLPVGNLTLRFFRPLVPLSPPQVQCY